MRTRLSLALSALTFLGCAASASGSVAQRAPASAAQRSRVASPRSSSPRPSEPERASEAPAADDLQRSHAQRPAIATVRGRASFYSDRLAGNRTASGDVYDPRLFTAASRELPFGTIVRVVREDTGASVIVRVNDRGPFGDRARILDLSRAAAEALGMIRAGVVAIRAEIVARPR